MVAGCHWKRGIPLLRVGWTLCPPTASRAGQQPCDDAAREALVGLRGPSRTAHAEIKHRINVVGIFPDEDAITGLVGAVALEHNEWRSAPTVYSIIYIELRLQIVRTHLDPLLPPRSESRNPAFGANPTSTAAAWEGERHGAVRFCDRRCRFPPLERAWPAPASGRYSRPGDTPCASVSSIPT